MASVVYLGDRKYTGIADFLSGSRLSSSLWFSGSSPHIIATNSHLILSCSRGSAVVVSGNLWSNSLPVISGSTNLSDYTLIDTFNDFSSSLTASIGTIVNNYLNDVSLTIFSGNQTNFICINAFSGNQSYYLPSSSASLGTAFVIKKIDSTDHIVTVYASGTDTIDNESYQTLESEGDCMTILPNGIDYWGIT